MISIDMEKTIFHVKGTHCPSCKILIEDVAKEIDGIVSCNVNFKTGETVIEHRPGTDLKKFKKEIESLGEYKVKTK